MINVRSLTTFVCLAEQDTETGFYTAFVVCRDCTGKDVKFKGVSRDHNRAITFALEEMAQSLLLEPTND